MTALVILATGVRAVGAGPVLAGEPAAEPSPTPPADPPVSASPSPSPSPVPAPSPSGVPVPTLAPEPVPGRIEPVSPSGEPTADADGSPRNVETAIAPKPALQSDGRASVAAVDDVFRPPSITVSVGTTVTWTNQGQNPHTVTANDRAFDSGTLETGQTFSVTFDRAGEIPYYCQIHGEPGSGMTGLVVVQADSEEEDEGAGANGTGGLPATGADPIPLTIVALALAVAGMAALRLGRGRR